MAKEQICTENRYWHYVLLKEVLQPSNLDLNPMGALGSSIELDPEFPSEARQENNNDH